MFQTSRNRSNINSINLQKGSESGRAIRFTAVSWFSNHLETGLRLLPCTMKNNWAVLRKKKITSVHLRISDAWPRAWYYVGPVPRESFPVTLRAVFTLNTYYKVTHCLFFLKRGASCVRDPGLRRNSNKPFGLCCTQGGFTRSNLC